MRVYAPTPADPHAMRRVQTIPLRHTNRRPVVGPPVRPDDLRVTAAALHAEAARLHMLRPEQVVELAAAADRAQCTDEGPPEWLTELDYWTGGPRAGGAMPNAVFAQHAPNTAMTGRDLDHLGALSASAELDRSALFAILSGNSDEPRDWLRAGEALSAGWLAATGRGISVLPLSAPVQIMSTRETMRRHLSYLNHPFLVLRFGTVDPGDANATNAPRPPTQQTIERL